MKVSFRFFFTALIFLLPPSAFAQPILNLGPFGPGVQDGSAPFNNDGNCASTTATAPAGDDCGEKNNQVRTQDTVSFNWSVIATSYTPGQANPQNVVLEQILHPSTQAVVSFERIPARCTPAGGGGTGSPVSSLVTAANGEVTLTCNLGEFAEGAQLSFSTVAKISGKSWNGETFTSTQRVYSKADSGTENATPSVYPTIGPIQISSRPMLDLSSSTFRGYYLYGNKDIGQGPENGFYTWVNMRLASPQKAGTEAIVTPFTFGFDLSATKLAVDGADYTSSGFEYYMDYCSYNTIGWADNVYGNEAYGATNLTSYPLNRKVIDSGTCSYNRDTPANNASPYTMTISGTNLSGDRYPTQTIGGTDLSAGPYYSMDMLARFFIPMRVIDLADGTSDGTGNIYIKNVLTNFDPTGVSGALNFAGNKEPGFNGNPMSDGSISNNIAQPYNYYLTTAGGWANYAFKTDSDNGAGYTFFDPANSHSGIGLLAPGQAHANTLHFGNSGSNDLSNPRACIAFDNTAQKLTDRSKSGGTAGTYAYVGTYNGSGFDSTNYLVEYGHVDFSGDNPLDKNNDGTSDYNNQTGRYEGVWTQQGNLRCDDSVTSWQTDPTQVGSGIDDVNVVRVRLKDALQATVKLSSAQYIRFVTPLEARQNFYQGPNAGQMIPMGTVLATFGSVRSDEYAPTWTPTVNTRPYQPSPENGNYDGDRVTLARTTSQLDSESLLPVASPGQSTSTLAGKQIVWKVTTAIQSLLDVAPQEHNVQIIDELPPEVTYNRNCTASYTDSSGTVIGTPADLVSYNTDRDGNTKAGYTRLVWNLGSVTAGVAIPPRVICTDSNALAANGTSVVNYAEIRGDSLISALSQRSDTHTITLEQVGSIQIDKKVDLTLDNANDTQVYTLSWANFAASFAIDAPTIIDVLPFVGDDSGSSPRTPASSFQGQMALTAAPTISWLSGATDGAPLGTWYYTTDAPAGISFDPDNNTSNWITESALGGDFSQVTAIKFVSSYALEKDGDPHQGMKATYTLQAGDPANPDNATANRPGDIYTNLFTLDTSSLPAEQYLKSNSVSVQVADYSVGDLVFADIDGNQHYDASVDALAPDGTLIELYTAADDALVASTTLGTIGKSGRYLFKNLGSGEYYLRIPASEFQAGGKLSGWNTFITTAGSDDDLNEATDQDGYTAGGVMVDGVRTQNFTLSATAPLPGDVPKGNEPLGDNTAGISDSTGDDFSNLTLDIALVPPDYGDAPASYGVAAHHVPLTALVYLGNTPPDSEAITANTANGGTDGTGDDNQGSDDEDGVAHFPVLNHAAPDYSLNIVSTNPSSSTAYLVGWIDFNHNGLFDSTEAASVAVPAGSTLKTVALTWKNLPVDTLAGDTYLRLRLTTDASVASGTASSSQPTGTALDGEVEDYPLTIISGYQVSGRVYEDANVNSLDDNETGLKKVTVVLQNMADGSCRSTRSQADGRYTFSGVLPADYTVYEAANEQLPTPATCPPAAADPNGYLSSSPNTLTLTVSSEDVSGQDFGDIRQPTFELDNQQVILPNTSVAYPHIFRSYTSGTASFSLTEVANPSGLTWGSQLYLDNNCDAQLDSADTLLTASLPVTAGDKHCLLVKVDAPANVNADAQHHLTITSTFNFGSGSSGLADSVLTHTDITQVAASDVTDPGQGGGKLKLLKSVWNVTRDINGSVALPGEILRYDIAYENIGTGSLNELVINDDVPEFTVLVPGSMHCTDRPAGLPACTSNDSLNGALSWVWSSADKLPAGARGSVSYQVTLE